MQVLGPYSAGIEDPSPEHNAQPEVAELGRRGGKERPAGEGCGKRPSVHSVEGAHQNSLLSVSTSIPDGAPLQGVRRSLEEEVRRTRTGRRRRRAAACEEEACLGILLCHPRPGQDALEVFWGWGRPLSAPQSLPGMRVRTDGPARRVGRRDARACRDPSSQGSGEDQGVNKAAGRQLWAHFQSHSPRASELAVASRKAKSISAEPSWGLGAGSHPGLAGRGHPHPIPQQDMVEPLLHAGISLTGITGY